MSGSTVRTVPVAGIILVALIAALFTTASVASAAPSLQIVVNNPAYETYAVDGSGAAYGTPVDSPNEIWRSLDEGATWTKRADFAAGYHVSYLTPLASGALIAAAASDNGTWNLLRSDDGAVSWTQVLEFPIEPCFYSTLTPHSVTEGDGFVYAGTYNLCEDQPNPNYIYRSADDGRTWSLVHTSTEHRHIHGLRFDPGTHALLALYGDSQGAIERSLDHGITWAPFCTTYAHCVGIDMALGDGFGIFGTDTPFRQNGIERIDLATGETTRLLDSSRDSFSALALGSGRFVVGTAYEDGTDLADGLLHLYASDDGAESFTDVYSVPITATGPQRMMVQFAFPNGDFVIDLYGGGTIVAHLAALPPENLTPPSISGSALQGQTLTASPGSWSLSPTGYGTAWQRCDSLGDACAPIAGANASTYTLVAADIDHTVRAVVTATNAGGSTSATSAGTAVVSSSVPPVNTTLPSIGGVAQQTLTLTASPGTWSGSTPTFTHAWLRCTPKGIGCVTIPGASSSTYQLVAADAGHTLRVVVTATNGAGAASATSAKSALVVALAPPANVALPSVGGVAGTGQTLTVSTGTWTGNPTSYGYSWQRCTPKGTGCVTIPGATSSAYQLVAADVGHTLRVVVTATNAGGTASVLSAKSALASGPTPPTNLTLPLVGGVAQQGQTLTASTGTWSGAPTSYSYVWQRCSRKGAGCVAIGGATAATYQLVEADVGQTLRVTVTATNDAGSSTPVTSNRSALVLASA